MKLVRTVKRSPVNFGSVALTVELTPADVGLPEPGTPEEVFRTWCALNLKAITLVEGSLVREGAMTPEEYSQLCSVYSKA